MRRLASKFVIAALSFALGLAASFAWNYTHPPVAPNCGQTEGANTPAGDDNALSAAHSDTPRLVSAFEDHINGKLISKPAPVYPPEAKAAGMSGDVTVGVIIDETGKVAYAWNESGEMPLSAAAIDAAYRLRCKPTVIGGKPVSVKSVVTYRFALP
jgi:protein TonB